MNCNPYRAAAMSAAIAAVPGSTDARRAP